MDQIAEHELITIISGRSQKSLAGLLGVATATLQPLTRDSNVFIRTCLFVLPKEELSPTTIGEGLFNQLTEYTALQITSKEDQIALPATSKEEAKADSAKIKNTSAPESKQTKGVADGYIQKSRLFEFHILEQSKKVDFSGSKRVDFLFLAKSKKVDFCYPKK